MAREPGDEESLWADMIVYQVEDAMCAFSANSSIILALFWTFSCAYYSFIMLA